MHLLLQRLIREALPEETLASRLRDARGLLRGAMPHPEDPAGWPLWRRLLPHVDAVCGPGADGDEAVAVLANDAAVFLWIQAEVLVDTNLVHSSFVSMKNVTVTMNEDVARWARVEAARRGLSVSRFLGSILEEEMDRDAEYRRAMRKFLAFHATGSSDGRPLPSRDDLHARSLR